MIVIPLLLLSLLQSPESKDAPAKPPIANVLSGEYLQKRFAVLQPELEKALGEPFSEKVRFTTMGIEQFAALLAKEDVQMRELQEKRTLDWDEREELARPWNSQALFCLAKLDVADRSIRFSPASFAYIADFHSAYECVNEPWFHDMLLMHEAVHLWQMSKVDFFKFCTDVPDLPTYRARAAVSEGMAQYFAAKAAEKMGRKADFDKYCAIYNLPTGKAKKGVGEQAAFDFFSRVVGFAYIEGHRFFAAVAASLGDGPAVKRCFEQPPTYLEISLPERYLKRK